MDILDIVFPKKCLECGKIGKYVCTVCLAKVPRAFSLCSGCGRATNGGLTHSFCKTKTPFDSVVSVWRYDGVIRKALIKLKFNFASSIAHELAELSCDHLNIDQLTGAILIPIPLHTRRENWRGFNQASKIGKIITAKMGWRFEPKLLKRTINTAHQTRLKKPERQKNIKGAFELNSKDSSLIPHQSLLILFDDVYTTGSTMKEAAWALRKAGFKKIVGLTVAS